MAAAAERVTHDMAITADMQKVYAAARDRRNLA
jgi:hypothetical protein